MSSSAKMRICSILYIALLLTSSALGQNSTVSRKKRFSIFNVVQFANTQCTLASSTSTNIMIGTCYTQSECSANGGSPSGNCASGFGVCCGFTASACGSTISKNLTYIQNPGFPTSFTTTGSCTYTFSANADICQIRLDFNNFVLNNPAPNTGVCTVDTFKINSASATGNLVLPVPGTICGTNTGSSVYLETGKQTSAGNIQINIGAGAATQIRTWKIKVTFIECSNPGRAPADCAQFLTGPAGTFSSFNYNGGSGMMINNLQYFICIRQENGFCSINYSEAGSNANTGTKAFSLDNQSDLSQRGPCIVGLIIPSSPTSAIAIDNSEVYCGTYLNPINGQKSAGIVTGTVAPFVVGVFSGPTLQGVNMGFNVMYEQVPC